MEKKMKNRYNAESQPDDVTVESLEASLREYDVGNLSPQEKWAYEQVQELVEYARKYEAEIVNYNRRRSSAIKSSLGYLGQLPKLPQEPSGSDHEPS